MRTALDPETYRRLYRGFAEQNPMWNEIPAPTGEVYRWDEESTYIQEPPFFQPFSMQPGRIEEIRAARPLAIFGDSVTTDHISPAGAIKAEFACGAVPAGTRRDRGGLQQLRRAPRQPPGHDARHLRQRAHQEPDGSGIEGGVTSYQPDGDMMSIYDAALRYQNARVPLLIVAGQEYGTGSSRDWAAKGTALLGVRAVIAQSFERIHRSNLVGMGVLPCQFREGVSAKSLGLDGTEVFDLLGLTDSIKPRQEITLVIHRHGRQQRQYPRDASHRHARGGRILCPRRYSALRAQAVAGAILVGNNSRDDDELAPGRG